MKKIHLLFVITSFIVFFSCEEKDSEIEFSLDTPNEFIVSKGDYVDKIVLDWNNPPKTERVEIFRFDSTLNDYKSIGFSETSSYIDSTEFISEAYYYYKIRVNNSTNELSDFTNYDYGYVSGFESPIITNIGYGTSSSSITIEWNTVTDQMVEGYPKSIAANWFGVWEDGISSAFYYAANKSIYFTRVFTSCH